MNDSADLLDIVWNEASQYQHNQRKEIAKQGKFDLVHIAASNQASEHSTGSDCLRYLIEKSEDPAALCSQVNNQVDKATPLHMAALVGNVNNCKMLIKQINKKKSKSKSLINPIDSKGNTPLHLALASNNKVLAKEVVFAFIQAGADATI